MKMKLFRYGYLIRIAFDHGRFFPIIIKQRGVSKVITAISSEIVDSPTIIWMHLNSIYNQIVILWSGQILGM